jgi:hypothetical protein
LTHTTTQLIFTAAFAAILAIYFPAAIEGQQNPKQKQTNTQNDKNPAVSPSTTNSCCPRQPEQEVQRDANHPNRDYWAKAFGPSTISNWVLVIVAVIGGCFAYRTLRAVERETLNGISASNSAIVSAKAAMKANEHAERALVVSHRPWVGAKEMNFLPQLPITAGVITAASITCENYGDGPALEVTTVCCFGSWSTRFTEAEAEREIAACGERSVFTIMPHSPASGGSAGCSDKFTEEIIRKVEAGEKWIYFFGKIEYKDVFGGKHWTRFCSEYDPKRRNFKYTPTYNDTDKA